MAGNAESVYRFITWEFPVKLPLMTILESILFWKNFQFSLMYMNELQWDNFGKNVESLAYFLVYCRCNTHIIIVCVAYFNSLRRISVDEWSLPWRHNGHDSVSNHQPHGCLLNRLFRRRSKKTSKLRVTGLCVGNSPGPVNSPHKGPVTRKMFPFDDVIL